MRWLYHPDPVEKPVFGKKLKAQTLEDLHVHVIGFQQDDLAEGKPLERSSVSRQEWRDIHDPFLEAARALWEQPQLRERMMEGIQSMVPEDGTELPGINLSVEADTITSETFARDLIALHQNFVSFYREIAGVFVDLDNTDSTGMPVLRSESERATRLETYFARIGEQTESVAFMQTLLRRINRLLQSGESVRAAMERPDDTLVFLRGPAYTLSIIRENNEPRAVVNLSPRVLSTGNFLATLRLHKVMNGNVSDEWVRRRERTEQAIRDKFAEKTQRLAA